MAFCDKGQVRNLSVTEEQLLESWKEFFQTPVPTGKTLNLGIRL